MKIAELLELLIAGIFMCLFLGIPVFLIYKVYKKTRRYSSKRHPAISNQTHEQNHANIIVQEQKTEQTEKYETVNGERINYYPYKKKMLLTKTEYAFYNILKMKCDKNNILICPKIRMEDFLEVTDKQNKLKYRGYIKSRHIDFMLCDSKLHLLAGIELDDKSHNEKEAAAIDHFKDRVFQTINIPLFRVKVMNVEQYGIQIDNILNKIID